MICTLVRHGQDDPSRRGGWSDAPLTAEGIAAVMALAEALAETTAEPIAKIFSSDLLRARQTAELLARRLCVGIEYLPEFREVNNGILAGMPNTEAEQKYPGLYWNTLAWEECYPGGESPLQFFDRISAAWASLRARIQGSAENVILVTHGGVINAIRHIEERLPYSNRERPFPAPHAQAYPIRF